jgi:asparagine synthase (glutamine-hydrolysing)
VKMDRMTMAHGLETRSPFLDTGLIEYVARLHPSLKIRHGRTKYILKQAFQDLLPREILARPKQGFAVPLDAWFRGELKGLVADLLLSGDARYREFLRADCVTRVHREHQSGVRNWGSELWALMNFEAWLQKQGAVSTVV